MIRIAVDAHVVGRQLTGNEVYIRSLLGAFAAVDDRAEFVAYVAGPETARWLPERFQVRRVAANPCRRLGWDLARLLRADKPDLLHVQYTAPLLTAVPTVVTVHDVSFLECPEYFTGARRLQLRATVARSVKRAAKILTVSRFSRDAIVRSYGLEPAQVHVVPNAANPHFHIACRDRARQWVRQNLQFDAPYIFTVGDLQPRKNQIGLIAAFAQLLTEHPWLPHRLVLTGQATWFAPKVKEAALASGFASRIHFTGFVPDHELLHLYNACECFVFPSFYEGFGLPILEAMACGRAVACSNTSAMPEVADRAALMFDPRKPEQIKRALADILLDPELRGRLESLGTQRAAAFNWEKSARATLEVYREVVAAQGGVRIRRANAAIASQ